MWKIYNILQIMTSANNIEHVGNKDLFGYLDRVLVIAISWRRNVNSLWSWLNLNLRSSDCLLFHSSILVLSFTTSSLALTSCLEMLARAWVLWRVPMYLKLAMVLKLLSSAMIGPSFDMEDLYDSSKALALSSSTSNSSDLTKRTMFLFQD